MAVSAKGYKMTANRKEILNLLLDEGGTLNSEKGRAVSLMHGLLNTGTTLANLSTALKLLEGLGFIERNTEGRKTFSISITPEGMDAIGVEVPAPSAVEEVKEEEVAAGPPADFNADEAAERISSSNGATADGPALSLVGDSNLSTAPIPEAEWDWQAEDQEQVLPEGIDYEALLGVLIKAAARGLVASNGGTEKALETKDEEIAYHKQRADLAEERAERLEHENESLTAKAAQAIAERDQLQQNLNVLMARFDKRPSRGGVSIRSQLSPEERSALDTLMRQAPTRRGE